MDETELALARRRQPISFGLFAETQRESSGAQLKEEGMERAREADDVQQWRHAFVKAVEELARRGTPFTSEDVTAIVGLPRDVQQNRNSAVGAMMNGLARRGIIRKTGRRLKSTRPQSHSAEILEWEATPIAEIAAKNDPMAGIPQPARLGRSAI